MRTFRGDIASSTCKDCKARGTLSRDEDGTPNCATCKCVCDAGVFKMKDVCVEDGKWQSTSRDVPGRLPDSTPWQKAVVKEERIIMVIAIHWKK
jgi:hypothetical protein